MSWLLSTTSHASIKRHATEVEVPDLTDPSLVAAGINDFESMCTDCHGAPDRGPTPLGQGLNPPAPNLAESAAHMSAAELFWVTKNGIKMTGMPAWGVTHQDEELWPVVAFLSKLPDMQAGDYQSKLAASTGIGHHATEAHDHGSEPQLGEHDVASEDDSSHHDGESDHSSHDDEPAPAHAHEDEPTEPPAHKDDHDHSH